MLASPEEEQDQKSRGKPFRPAVTLDSVFHSPVPGKRQLSWVKRRFEEASALWAGLA